MQINSVVNLQNIQRQQNFKGSSANSSPFTKFSNYQPVPLDAAKAYAAPQITEGYREINTFDVPYVGKGKLYELANGHKVIIVPKASKTYISTIISAGLLDEPADKKDIAHLTEHLLANYWHNASQTSDITKILKETGAYSNASTGNYTSSYYMSANIQDDSDLENLIMLQLAILKNNNFNEAKIQKEKDIIIEENKEKGYLIDDERSAENQTIKNLFCLNDSNKTTAETTIQKIENIKKEDLENFYNNFYRPDNMTTIIIGNVDDQSIKIISKYLNKMNNPKSNIERKNLVEINKENYINQFTRIDIESKDKSNKYNYFINLSFIGPTISNPKDTESSMILNKIIKNRLREQNINVDIDIPSIFNDKKIPQIISIKHNTTKDNLSNNIEIIYSIINDLRKTPVSKEELDKAKEQFFEELSDKLEDNETLTYLLNDILVSGANMNIKPLIENFQNTHVIDIQNTAQKYLDLNKSSLVVVHPNNNESQAPNEVSFKGLADLTNTKDIKEYDLPNNLHLVIDSRPGIIKTAVSCRFLYEDQQNNNSGMIEALNSSLIRDNSAEFPVGNWVQSDGIFIRKYGSIHNVQKIIENIKKDLLYPEFNEKELEEYKQFQQKHLQEINGNSNNTIHLNKLQLLEYENALETKNKIVPEDLTTGSLKIYYNRLLKTSQGTIIISIPKEELAEIEPEIIKTLSEIPSVRPQNLSKIKNQINPKEIEKNSIFLNKYDSDDKVEIEKNFKIIHNGDIKDEAGIILLNEILNSKLKLLRNDLGLTYGAYSRFDKCSCKHGVLTISTETAKIPLQDSTKIALEQINSIVNDLMTSKIDEEILNSTKKQIKADLLIPAETSIDRNLDLEKSYEKSFDIYHSSKLAEALEGITSDDLQKIAQKYLTKHYLLEISGNTNAIDYNKDYFSTLGEITD